MSLVADYSSDESSDDDNCSKISTLKKSESFQLPSAASLLTGNPGEVFNNVYKKAEDMKIASLEKHCKMVDNKEHMKEKNGKKICWNYRKGRCRFGSNCTFAHDSDLHNTIINSKEFQTQKQDIPKTASIINTQKPNCNNHNSEFIKQASSTTTTTTTSVKRNRPGLGDSLIPSKKIMKTFYSTSGGNGKKLTRK